MGRTTQSRAWLAFMVSGIVAAFAARDEGANSGNTGRDWQHLLPQPSDRGGRSDSDVAQVAPHIHRGGNVINGEASLVYKASLAGEASQPCGNLNETEFKTRFRKANGNTSSEFLNLDQFKIFTKLCAKAEGSDGKEFNGWFESRWQDLFRLVKNFNDQLTWTSTWDFLCRKETFKNNYGYMGPQGYLQVCKKVFEECADLKSGMDVNQFGEFLTHPELEGVFDTYKMESWQYETPADIFVQVLQETGGGRDGKIQWKMNQKGMGKFIEDQGDYTRSV